MLSPADGPPSSLPMLSVITFGGSGSSSSKTQQQQQGQQQGQQQRRHRTLSIERPEALTAVLALPGHELLAAGDGGAVRRLCFNPLWTAFTWGEGELELAECSGQEVADIQHLVLLPPRPDAAAAPVQPPPLSPALVELQQSGAPPGELGAQEMTPLVWHQRRRARLLQGSAAKRRARMAASGGAPGCLLAGLSSDGSLAVWDLGTGHLLAAHMHPDYQLLSLAPLSGLFRTPPAAVAAPVAGNHLPEAAAAAAAPAAPALSGPLAFLCLARSRQTGRRTATAAVLSAGGLLVLKLEPVADGPAAVVCCDPGPVACATIAGRAGLLANSQGHLACWDLLTGLCTTALANCCAGAATLADPGVNSLLLVPAGGQGGVPEGGGGPSRVGAVLLTSASGHCNLLDVKDLCLPEQLAQ